MIYFFILVSYFYWIDTLHEAKDYILIFYILNVYVQENFKMNSS